jgi:hypothetical protein
VVEVETKALKEDKVQLVLQVVKVQQVPRVQLAQVRLKVQQVLQVQLVVLVVVALKVL